MLKRQGIMTGFEDGSSRLNESMSREQFAFVLYKLLDLPRSNSTPGFVDVLKTRWSFTAVQAVRSAGIMVGKGDNRFEPTAPVKVEELAAVLLKVNNVPANPNVGFVGKVSAWRRLRSEPLLAKAGSPLGTTTRSKPREACSWRLSTRSIRAGTVRST